MEGLAPPVEPHLQVSDKYADTLLELVNFNDVQAKETTSDGEEQDLNETGASKTPSNHNRLSRYVSFPSPRKVMSHSLSSDEGDEGSALALENLSSQEQVPAKLKSAMKGSREKGGASPRKMRVTWAPDVYDPPPTSLSHSVKRGSRQQKLSKKDKRHGKRGHKGKDFSRGGGSSSKDSSKGVHGKDKKKKPSCQTTGSSSSMRYKLRDDGNDLALMSKEKVDNFGFGVHDASCGSSSSSSSSFFKVSLSTAQYPVAEAL